MEGIEYPLDGPLQKEGEDRHTSREDQVADIKCSHLGIVVDPGKRDQYPGA